MYFTLEIYEINDALIAHSRSGQVSNEKKSPLFLGQVIGMALQRGNAARVSGKGTLISKDPFASYSEFRDFHRLQL